MIIVYIIGIVNLNKTFCAIIDNAHTSKIKCLSHWTFYNDKWHVRFVFVDFCDIHLKCIKYT